MPTASVLSKEPPQRNPEGVTGRGMAGEHRWAGTTSGEPGLQM